MSLWIQHGYGKGDKIWRIAKEALLGGVVLSPADEKRAQLAELHKDLRDAEIPALLDPQLYVYNIDGAVGRCHKSHGLVFEDVQWSLSASQVARHVDAVVDANKAIGTRTILAPSPLQATFMDFWSPLALQYARTALESAGKRAVWGSVIVGEEGLGDWDDIETWLDAATQLDLAGFYVVIARSSVPYPEAWDYKRLSNYLRLVYRLRKADYEIVAGYTDLEALPLSAVGAQPASGWFYTQRRFTETKWRRGVGGQPPTPRVLSDSLLVPLLIHEAQPIANSSRAGWVSSDESVRSAVSRGDWSLGSSRSQHLHQLGSLLADVEEGNSTGARIDRLGSKLRVAVNRLRQLGAEGLLVSAPSYVRLVESIGKAVEEFASAEGPFTSRSA